MAEFIVSTLDDETFDGGTLEQETADGGGLSLREAIALANDAAGADTISFGAGGQGLLRLTEGRIRITDETVIDGGGEVTITGDAGTNDVTLAGGITDVAATLEANSDGLADNSQIFNATRSLTLTDLTLTGGATDGFLQVGGAVASSADITLISTVIAGNATLNDLASGGGLYSATDIVIIGGQITGNSTDGQGSAGGGVFARNSLTVTDATITDNQTLSNASRGGGLYTFRGDTIVTNSTVSGNSTAGNFSSGGGIYGEGTITVNSGEVSGNSTAGDSATGGGISGNLNGTDITITNAAILNNTTAGADSFGGGLAADGDVTITNSTVSGNRTTGDDSNGGGALAQGILTLTNSTFTNNSVTGANSDGGGVVGGASLAVANSIVLGNFAMQGDNGELVETAGDGAPTFTGANIVGADGGAFDATVSANVQNAHPALVFAQTTNNNGVTAGALADNGGPTQTVALNAAAANPALDAATIAGVDARGSARSVDLNFIDNGGASDLGSFELQNQFLFAPAFSGETSFSVAESQTAVADLTATDDKDAEGAGLTFSIAGGADAALFAIDAATGTINFVSAPDFEAPGDADGDNAHAVTVRVTDAGGLTADQSLTVTVSDVDETPPPPVGPTEDADLLTGTAGNDTIRALGGDDTVIGLAGDDALFGDSGDDVVRGSGGDDRIRGNAGDDNLKGNGGEDNINGGGGSDVIRGGGGGDVIKGGGGADTVKGGGGADKINGGGGADRLDGGGGNDTITGRNGDDTLKGNGGADVFQFRSSDRNDTVLDFRQGQDKIEIINGANSFAGLTFEQDGADVLIGFGQGQVRIVTDQVGAFDENDFIF